MTDRRSEYDEQLPWLEAVDDDDSRRGLSAGKMLAALGVVVVALLLIFATFFWLGQRDPASISGAPELIRAEPGPYKVKPADPGGLDVAGESETAFQTSAGEDTDAQLNLNALPGGAPPLPAEQTNTAAPAAEKPEPKPEPPAAAGPGSVVQLGAYKNSAQAERAWTSLSSRFPSVSAMTKTIVPFSGGIRLRAVAASPAEARQACQTLKAAGENCFVAQ